jgi:hypothetical protein
VRFRWLLKKTGFRRRGKAARSEPKLSQASKIAPAYNKGALQCQKPAGRERPPRVPTRARGEQHNPKRCSVARWVLTLVETPRHEKDDTQDQYGDHASGQKTAAVTSHEIHHVGSRKWLILRPKRIASIPSSNRPRTHGGRL